MLTMKSPLYAIMHLSSFTLATQGYSTSRKKKDWSVKYFYSRKRSAGEIRSARKSIATDGSALGRRGGRGRRIATKASALVKEVSEREGGKIRDAIQGGEDAHEREHAVKKEGTW